MLTAQDHRLAPSAACASRDPDAKAAMGREQLRAREGLAPLDACETMLPAWKLLSAPRSAMKDLCLTFLESSVAT